jgi:hypothetical protein
MQKILNLADITLSQAYFVRDTINMEVVEDYAEALNAKAVFPAVDVFKVGRGYTLVDGWHRFYAYRKANKKNILANIHEGEREDCLRFALKCNRIHGLRRSNADKKRSAMLAIREWPKLVGREIADMVGVSHTYIDRLRQSMIEQSTRARPVPRAEFKIELPRTEAEPPIVVPPMDNGDIKHDAMGYPIPEKIQVNWERSFEVQSVIDLVEQLEQILQHAQASKDAIWHEVVFQSAFSDLSRVMQNVSTAKPYVVCTSCQGQLADTCTLCGGKGFISKFRWENVVPLEIREMRKEACK